jgi:hypothetical protein
LALELPGDPDFDGESSPLKVPCVLLSPGIGIQAPPQGGERCVLIPLEDNSYGCLLVTGEDDNQPAPAGEVWLQRDDPTNTPPADQKQFVKIQTDGAPASAPRQKSRCCAQSSTLGPSRCKPTMSWSAKPTCKGPSMTSFAW